MWRCFNVALFCSISRKVMGYNKLFLIRMEEKRKVVAGRWRQWNNYRCTVRTPVKLTVATVDTITHLPA